MRKIALSAVSLILCALIIALTGCDLSVNLKEKEESTKAEPDTAIVEVTDKKGEVVATELVTMSDKDKEESELFFKPVEKAEEGVDKDRVEQALKDDTANKKETTTKKNDKKEDSGSSFEDEMNDTTAAPSYVQDDAAVIRSNQYFVSGRIKMDGKVSPYKIARKGNKSAITLKHEGKNIGFIITEDVMYLLSIDEKQYVEFPKALLEENMTEEEMRLVMSNPFVVERDIKKRTTEKIDGVKYDVVVYESGAKDYFLNKSLIMTTAEDGSVMYYDNISTIAPSSLFAPPKDFKKAEMEDATDIVNVTEEKKK